MLNTSEIFWCTHQPWLQHSGYMLRPRYLPDWTPSWLGTTKHPYTCEDGTFNMDAVRISDGAQVALKLIRKSVHPYEIDIGVFFATEPLKSDPQNHCVPLLDVLQVPDDTDQAILVMPMLRVYEDPRFDTIGEGVEFFRQIFEGLQFMHKHRVAHRDCQAPNIMMDAEPIGSVSHFTRTQRPVKYYFIDFGISRHYEPSEVPPLEDPIWGGDKTVPEFQFSDGPCDPFPTDIYYLGNLIRTEFLMGTEFSTRRIGFDFMWPLVRDMVQDDPAKRPTINDVVARFEVIRCGLSSWTLRTRVAKAGDYPIPGLFRAVSHWKRRIGFILSRTPALPTPAMPTFIQGKTSSSSD
ncbi:kinase-like domain-containing protein [Infundibulicybe gibba]|nr:kinase-like domain-containing protein [Infundibulicybe gibba]